MNLKQLNDTTWYELEPTKKCVWCESRVNYEDTPLDWPTTHTCARITRENIVKATSGKENIFINLSGIQLTVDEWREIESELETAILNLKDKSNEQSK